MPIATDLTNIINNIGITPVIDEIPTNTNLNYQAPYVDNSEFSTSNLATFISGYSWYPDVYQQIITRDTQLSAQQVTVNSVLQQYRKIKGLKVKVETPLEFTQDNGTKTDTQQGSGVVFGYVPNEGDLLVANISPTERMIFHITQSVQKSIFKETAYMINYQSDTTDPEYLDDLEHKVVETLIYVDKDQGDFALVTDSVYKSYTDLGKALKVELRRYFETIYDHEYGTFNVLGQPVAVYDYYLTRFITSAFEINSHPFIVKARQYTPPPDAGRLYTIYDGLLKKDLSIINVRTMGMIDVGIINADYTDIYSSSVTTSGMPYCVYPLAAYKRNRQDFNTLKYQYRTANNVFVDAGGPNRIANFNMNTNALTTPSLPSPNPSNGYVLSQAFYAQDAAHYSTLDQLVLAYINDDEIDIEGILNILNLVNTWSDLSYYYYTPIILFIGTQVYNNGLNRS